MANNFFTLETSVNDALTGQPLVGATVVLTDSTGTPIKVNGNVIGRKTDANGEFIMPINANNAYVTVSYLGYSKITAPATQFQYASIVLMPATNNLQEIVIKGGSSAKEKKGFDWSSLLNILGNRQQQPVYVNTPPINNTNLYLIIGISTLAIIGIVMYFNSNSK